MIGFLFSKITKTMEKVIINANNMAEYNKLKAQGGRVLWVGEGKICFEVKTL